MDSDNPASDFSRKMLFFKDGCPENWIKWVMAFCEIEYLMLFKEAADKTRMFQTLLKDQALSCFEYHLRKRMEAGASEFPGNQLI
jgi:hypothetical protein